MTQKTKVLNKMVKILCKKEKGKKQLNAGNAREVLKVITELLLKDQGFMQMHAEYCNERMSEIQKENDKAKAKEEKSNDPNPEA